MAKLVPWQDVSEVQSTLQITIPKTRSAGELISSNYAELRSTLLDYCEKQPKQLFWGSSTALSLLIALFALVVSEQSAGFVHMVSSAVLRFGLVMGVLSSIQLLRKAE